MDYEDMIRKRRALARDYIANVPEEWVNLDHVMVDANGDGIFPFERWEGLQNPCGAVGCVLGWLTTMPELREWARLTRNGVGEWGVRKFLGISDLVCGLFTVRTRYAIPQKQEAMERMERLQTLPIIHYDEPTGGMK